MRKGLIFFAVLSVGAAWAFGLLAFFLQDALGQYAGLVMLPMAVVPLIAAYLGHRMTAGAGNPFRGLVWGGGGMIVGAWLFGLVIGYLAVALSLGLQLQGLDTELNSYLEMVQTQSADRGQELPDSALGMIRTTGLATVYISPLIGAWFFAAFGCLSMFPWLGWFGRRLLVYGRTQTVLVLTGLFALTSLSAGFIDNPQLEGVSLPLRLLLMAVAGAVSTPLLLWLFLKSRSAVIPAIVQGSIQAALGGMVPMLTAGNSLICPPAGFLTHLVILGAGLALWIWKDPGGDDLAVAAVAFDGTPLTPAMVRQLEEEEAAFARQISQSATSTPPDPPVKPVE